MSRGEVWWAESRTGGKRPYLILTRDVAIPLLHSVLAAPATRTIRGIPTEVELDSEDGMPQACAVSLDNLTLMPKSRFTNRICTLQAERLTAICVALGAAADC